MKKGLKAIIIFLIVIISVSSFQVAARTAVNLSSKAELTVEYPVNNVEFRLYRVADISKYAEFEVTNEFKAYSVDFTDDGEWNELALALDGYIARDGVAPTAAATSASKKAEWKNLDLGIYLVSWDLHSDDEYSYIPQPFFVTLPNLDENDNWLYSVKAIPKYEKEALPEKKDIRVHKKWEDWGNTAARPKEITVQLIKGKEVFDTAVLNKQNGWSYTFKDLLAEEAWRVVEKDVPDGYTVSLAQEGEILVITNTGEPPFTPPSSENLPQTGMLLWPIFVLLPIGAALLIFGIVLYSKRKNEN